MTNRGESGIITAAYFSITNLLRLCPKVAGFLAAFID